LPKKAIGIDIGGTGIKGGLVDTRGGVLISSRIKKETPSGGEPEGIAGAVAEIVAQLGNRRDRPIGICFPAVVEDGVTKSAANVSMVPNAELGHLEIDGIDYETKASYAAKERENLNFAQWAERLQRYYTELERLFSPKLFIVGGGISKSHSEFLPLLKLKTPIVPAKLKNSAGIIGAAALVNEDY